jgi:hypothetical protein
MRSSPETMNELSSSRRLLLALDGAEANGSERDRAGELGLAVLEQLVGSGEAQMTAAADEALVAGAGGEELESNRNILPPTCSRGTRNRPP